MVTYRRVAWEVQHELVIAIVAFLIHHTRVNTMTSGISGVTFSVLPKGSLRVVLIGLSMIRFLQNILGLLLMLIAKTLEEGGGGCYLLVSLPGNYLSVPEIQRYVSLSD